MTLQRVERAGTHKTIEECANDNNPKNLALIRCIAVIHAFEAQGLVGSHTFLKAFLREPACTRTFRS